jgi:carbamoyl-phosphate synthase large subunit
VLDQEKPDYVVSTVDEEIPVFHRLVEQRFPSMRVVTACARFCDVMLDKWKAMQALHAAGIAVPETWLATGAPDDCYPAIIKPRSGRGSRAVALLEGPKDLTEYLSDAEGKPDDYIVQRRIEGQEYTVSGVVALGGPLLAVVPKEVVIKQGVTRVGITREVPAIERACRAIQDRLAANGPFNAQLILGLDGVPYVFEINPRYSTTTALTIASGLNEVDAVIQRAEGKSYGELAFRPGLCMVRYTAALYVNEIDWPVAEQA